MKTKMKKILLVDDEKDIVEFLKYNLELENFEVIVGSNGEEALLKLNENPDLIIYSKGIQQFLLLVDKTHSTKQS